MGPRGLLPVSPDGSSGRMSGTRRASNSLSHRSRRGYRSYRSSYRDSRCRSYAWVRLLGVEEGRTSLERSASALLRQTAGRSRPAVSRGSTAIASALARSCSYKAKFSRALEDRAMCVALEISGKGLRYTLRASEGLGPASHVGNFGCLIQTWLDSILFCGFNYCFIYSSFSGTRYRKDGLARQRFGSIRHNIRHTWQLAWTSTASTCSPGLQRVPSLRPATTAPALTPRRHSQVRASAPVPDLSRPLRRPCIRLLSPEPSTCTPTDSSGSPSFCVTGMPLTSAEIAATRVYFSGLAAHLAAAQQKRPHSCQLQQQQTPAQSTDPTQGTGAATVTILDGAFGAPPPAPSFATERNLGFRKVSLPCCAWL